MSKFKATMQSRKFIVSAFVMFLAAGLFMAGHIDVDKMLEVEKWAAGIYVGALSLEDAARQIFPALKALNVKAETE